MMKALLAAGAVLAAATAANADYTINLGTFTNWAGGSSVSVTTANLTGTLTGFYVEWGYSNSQNASYSSDAAVVINGTNLWQGPFTDLTFGGTLVANWGAGINADSANHQFQSDTQNLPAAVVYNGTSGATVLFGNSYSTGIGTWSFVTIRLIGVVPTPGALALLGMAGFVSRRRRA